MNIRLPNLTLLLLGLLLVGPGLSFGQEREVLASLLPPPSDGPVRVRAAFHLMDINEIDDESESFSFSGVLSLRWSDPRRAFDAAAFGADEKVFTGDFQFQELATGWYPEVVLLNTSGSYEQMGTVLRLSKDGQIHLIHMVTATAESKMDLRRYPYDSQQLTAYFKVLGFGSDQVVLVADPSHASGFQQGIRIPQWGFDGMETANRELRVPLGGGYVSAATFAITASVQRNRWYIVRLLVIPLAIIVALSWSVFWMDASSLGDRMSVSFVGILAAVAYQIVIGDILPKISYHTPIHAFINLSFCLMSLTVIINLRVGACDKRGDPKRGDRIDRCCRWAFPSFFFLGFAAIIAAALLTN